MLSVQQSTASAYFKGTGYEFVAESNNILKVVYVPIGSWLFPTNLYPPIVMSVVEESEGAFK